MSSTRVIRVSSFLWEELGSGLRSPADGAALSTLVMAAYLDLASEGHGLSDLHDSEVSDRLNAPSAFLPLISRYIGARAGHVDPDEVRDALYATLLRIVDVQTSRENAERDLRTAQVYWALSDDGGRRDRLPYRSGVEISPGHRALIYEPNRQHDLAVLRRTPRADALTGQGLSSGVALRKAGARLAVALAKVMTSSIPTAAADPGRPEIHVEVCTIAGKHHIEVDPSGGKGEGEDTGAKSNSTLVSGPPRPSSGGPLQNLHDSAQQYGAKGLHLQAAAVRSSMVEILRQYSESNPVDGEDALAAAGMLAGFSYMDADRHDLALLEFQQAAQIDELLTILNDDDAPAVRLIAERAMIAVISLTAFRYDDARQSLTHSLNTAQDLADGDPTHEDLLVLILILVGTLEMQTNDLPRARFAFARAVKIARKLLSRSQEVIQIGQLASVSLLMLGTLHLIEDSLPAARACLEEGIDILNQRPHGGLPGRSTRYFIGALQLFLGETYSHGDRPAEASDAWLAAADCLEGIDGDDLTGRGAALIRLQSLLNLAIASLDDDDELAHGYAERAVQVGRLLDNTQLWNDQSLQLFGTSLMVLSAAAYALNDHSAALSSVQESIATLQRVGSSDSDELHAQAREMLDELLEEVQDTKSTDGGDDTIAERKTRQASDER